MYLMGLTYLLLATSLNTAVQARVDDAFRGRAMAIYLSALLLGVPVGTLIQGKLAAMTDLRVVVAASGVLLGLFVIYAFARYDRLRPLDEDLSVHTDPLLQGQPAIAGAD
jgi:MFS family permease